MSHLPTPLRLVSAVSAVVVFVGLAHYFPGVVRPVEFPVRLAITAGLSLFVVILLSTGIGTTVPLFLHRFGVEKSEA